MLPKGFKYAGVHAGLKKKKKLDMGLIVSEVPAVCSGTLTTNQAAAACVNHNRLVLKKGKASAIVVNSKNANAVTGDKGVANNLLMAKGVADIFGGPVLTASTGIIGVQMPMNKIQNGIKLFEKNLKENIDDFSQAIMTTDLVPKTISKTVKINNKKVTISGVAKGSGMIEPNMATMLAFITTDAKISKNLLQRTLNAYVGKTFNQISVDTDTSTNDMCLCLANGMSGVKIAANHNAFFKALYDVCEYLAKEIARDGEGATKLIEVTVKGAKKEKDAQVVAKSIAASPLVKCAVYGEDDNWGRVIMAVGKAGVKLDPEKVKMKWTGLKTKEVKINVDLGLGKAQGKAWGCDLTEKYIEINTDYN